MLVGDADAFGAALEAAGLGRIVIERDEAPVAAGPLDEADEPGPIDDETETGPTAGAEEPIDPRHRRREVDPRGRRGRLASDLTRAETFCGASSQGSSGRSMRPATLGDDERCETTSSWSAALRSR